MGESHSPKSGGPEPHGPLEVYAYESKTPIGCKYAGIHVTTKYCFECE